MAFEHNLQMKTVDVVALRSSEDTGDSRYDTVREEPLLLEAFGDCLPSNQAGVAFARKVLDKKSLNESLSYAR